MQLDIRIIEKANIELQEIKYMDYFWGRIVQKEFRGENYNERI